MKKLRQGLFSDETTDTSEVLDDEIDRLFMQLEQIAPPPELIENILASVARLPLPQLLSEGPDTEELERLDPDSDGPLVRNPHLQPS